MIISRREFLKATGGAFAGLLAGCVKIEKETIKPDMLCHHCESAAPDIALAIAMPARLMAATRR